MTATLYDFAHARTGDKGDLINISVIAYDAAHYEALVREVTPERVAEHFAYRRPTAVRRYLLPHIGAMNFVLERVLDGAQEPELFAYVLDAVMTVSITIELRDQVRKTPRRRAN